MVCFTKEVAVTEAEQIGAASIMGGTGSGTLRNGTDSALSDDCGMSAGLHYRTSGVAARADWPVRPFWPQAANDSSGTVAPLA